MNFEFSEDQNMLRDQARRFLEKESPLTDVRKILDGEAIWQEKTWKEIVEMGWLGTALPEAYGGIDMGYLELCVIAEELGRSLAATPFSSSVYLASEAILATGSDQQKNDVLTKLATGEQIGTLAVSEKAGGLATRNIEMTASGNKLSGTKMPVPDGDLADIAVVAARNGDDVGLFLVDLSADGVSRETLETVDPTRNHAKLTFDNVEAEPLSGGWDALNSVLDRAAILFAFEQLGGAQAALEMGRQYALDRYAFGRPIGSFQAIKHKLADMYCAVELARSNCYYGAWALSTNADELPIAAATARVSATQAYYESSKENIQTHGGMGFTWEFDCHLYYRRAKLLSLAIGSELHWKDLLIGRLEAARQAAA
ncbi:MAG: acyl-CoA dehydrogenase family protein [Pseudomonadota bacterium]